MSGTGPSWIETDRLSGLVALTAWRRPAASGTTSRFGVTEVHARFDDDGQNRTLVTPIPEPPPVGAVSMAGPIETRLDALMAWSVSTLKLSSAYVADDEGLLLASTSEVALPPVVTTCIDTLVRQWTRYAARPRGCLIVRADGLAHAVAWTNLGERTYFLVVSGAHHDDFAPVDPLVEGLASALESKDR
jgi:hypothetical protein